MLGVRPLTSADEVHAADALVVRVEAPGTLFRALSRQPDSDALLATIPLE